MNSQPITTKDNSKYRLKEEDICHLEVVKKLAEPTISELSLEDNPNLLVFPQNLDVYGDKIGDAHIFEVKGQEIVTGNIMGFVGCGNTKISISSRFTNDKEDFFLHYMLEKVFAINMFDLQFNSDEESIFDFLLYLFPSFLKRAIHQGVYREYQARLYNDANVKGRIDVSRYIRQNIPFTGKIAYTTREYAYDNHLTQLIRHTIEYISRHRFAGNILYNDEDTIDAVKRICQVTTTYNRNERQKVINQNLRPISHPYFGEYRPLQQLCLQILRQEEMKYGRDDDEIYGILFDGAWLWEEYLNTFLADIGFVHPRNKTNNVGKKMFIDPKRVLMQPDFFIDNKIVLDAKYKKHESLFDDKQREDRFQLIAYMHVFNVMKSGFIVPVPAKGERFTKGEIAGKGGEMYLIGINVNEKAENYKKYYNYMTSEEKNILEQINMYINTKT